MGPGLKELCDMKSKSLRYRLGLKNLAHALRKWVFQVLPHSLYIDKVQGPNACRLKHYKLVRFLYFMYRVGKCII